eukprot:5852510-Ditylum_brightwellii.AAC.1
MEVVVKKRLGKDVPTYIMNMLKSEEEDVVLLYPGKDAVRRRACASAAVGEQQQAVLGGWRRC